jgi:hypothetical protein
VFVQQDEQAVLQQWDQVIAMLSEKLPTAAALMEQAREDVLAFRNFPSEHWRKIWSTNPRERLNKKIKRRTRVVGIFPNDASIVRLVGALLLELREEWQLDGQAGQHQRSAPRSTNSCYRCSCLITMLRSGHRARVLHHSKGSHIGDGVLNPTPEGPDLVTGQLAFCHHAVIPMALTGSDMLSKVNPLPCVPGGTA